MQSIQPNTLSNEELLRYAHTVGYDKLDSAWLKTFAERLSQEVDKREEIYNDGFNDGYDDAVENATDDFK